MTSFLRTRKKSIPAEERNHYKRVASLPCAECGIEGYSQCAHSNLAKHGKGLGLKANYLMTFPLCCTRIGVLGCHAEHDQLIGMTKQQAEDRTERYIKETHARLGVNL